MFVIRSTEAGNRTKVLDGAVARVLLEASDPVVPTFAVTWNDVNPNALKGTHAHESTQAYLVVRGEGRMHVGAETTMLGAGDLVFVPSLVEHGIENVGSTVLTYVAITAPAVAYTPGWTSDVQDG